MKKTILLAVSALFIGYTAQAQEPVFPRSQAEDTNGYMSEGYWKIWNPEEQARIDADIDKYRKADGELVLENLGRKRDVKIEQVEHEFIFGAHIFNFNQLGKKEYNDRYKELYGTLFNRATVPFYWKELELERGKPRFATEYRDTEEFWNNCKDPHTELHWRRPSTDQIVDFCESKGIRMHGHVLVWGSRKWNMPYWYQDLMSKEERESFLRYFPNEPDRWDERDVMSREWRHMSFDEVAKTFATFVKNLDNAHENRIKQIAERYKGRLHSFDICNESAEDDCANLIPENHAASKSLYGVMSGDYVYKSFKWAEKYFPKEVALNINDFFKRPCYTAQTTRLIERGCKIDVMGLQMHLFKLEECQGIADGKMIQTPSQVREYIGYANKTGLPLHLSEITITAPSQDERGLMIQAIIAQQLYRLWFSQEKIIGITWWNVVDGCGAKKEPTVSGLFTREMQAKPSYYALNQLINNEWKTNTTVQADANGKVQFRGFKGKYRITYKDKKGKTQVVEYTLK